MTSNSPATERWRAFLARRPEHVRELAASIEAGVARRDTEHPVFDGCIDWHSCVHGVYALLVASRLTGDSRWARAAEAKLTPEGLALELDRVARGVLPQEIPYGYAWLLRLACEREAHGGRRDLRALAGEVASQLADWLRSLSDAELAAKTTDPEYHNASWALANLWHWAVSVGDAALQAELRRFARERLARLRDRVPPDLDATPKGFFAPSLQRISALLAVLGPEALEREPDAIALEPVAVPPSTHAAGLNFSRSWGYWSLYRATGSSAHRDAYRAHVEAHLATPAYWRDDYRRHAHWVPQFGVHALALPD